MPMGEYKDFADCVAKNKDKADPKAYCGAIKHKIEGKNLADNLFVKIAKLEKFTTPEAGTTYRGIISSTAVDYDGERMSKKALHGLREDLLRNTSVFFNHNYNGLAVAKTVNAWVEEHGDAAELWGEYIPTKAHGPINDSGILVESVVQQLEEGTLKCLSVGGKKVKDFQEKGITVLDEVKGLEYSLVGIGANPDAMNKTFAKKLYLDSVKSRMEAFDSDNLPTERTMHEESEEKVEDRIPVVPPVTESAKDKKKVEQEKKPDAAGNNYKNPFDATYFKGGGMAEDIAKMKCPKCGYDGEKAAEPEIKKEVQGSTPNKPALLTESDMDEIVARVMAKIKPQEHPITVGTTSKSSVPEIPPEPEKVVKTALEDKVEKLLDKVESMALSNGLTPQENKFDSAGIPASTEKSVKAIDVFSQMIGAQ